MALSFPRISPRLVRLGLVAMVFLAVWSTKLMTLARFGTDLPYWDQWAKEGEYLYQPWFERHELWKFLFLPHNEHRIAPTLALNLGLVLVGDTWDARVQCAASAALHAAIAAALAWWSLRRLGRGWGLAAVFLLVLVAAPPIAWENVLGGFQSVFYFLAAFSLFAIHALLTARAGSWRWVAGIAAAALACVSMGSGMLVAFPIAVLCLVRALRPSLRRDAIASAIAASAIGGVGWWLRPVAPWHEVIHAHSLGQSVVYALRALSWPAYEWPWLSVMLWAPWLALALVRLRSIRSTYSLGAPARSAALPPAFAAAAVDFVLAAGLWVLVQIAAVSYSRAGASTLPAPRYGDVCALGLFFNFAALALLPAPTRVRRTAAIGFVAVTVVVVALASRDALTGPLPQKKADAVAYERSVRAFVASGDEAAFAKAVIPFPSAEWLARILRNPTLNRLLPVSVRAPLALDPSPGAAAGMVRRDALPDQVTWVLQAPSEWRSATMPPSRGWWKFETTGAVGTSGASLTLVSATSGRTLATIAPTKPAGTSWRAAYVRAPRESAVLVARVTEPGTHLGFSAPTAMSSLSHAVWRLSERAGWLLALAGVGLLVFAFATMRADDAVSGSGTIDRPA